MKHKLFFSRYKFTSLVLSLIIVIIFSSCESDNDPLSNITRVSMKTLPQVEYVIGTALNLSNMVITLDRGGNNVDIPFSSFEEENISTDPKNGKILDVSDKSVTIQISDSGKGLIQAINVTNNVTTIEVKATPKNKYILNQALDLSNLELTFTYQNGENKDFVYNEIVKDIETTPANGEKLTSTNIDEITITHVSTGVNVTTAVSVIRFLPSKGELLTMPTKTVYKVGDELDLTGTVIRYTLFNGSTIDADFENFSAFNLTVSPANTTVLNTSNNLVRVTHVIGGTVRIPITVTP